MNKRHYEHTLPNIRGSLSNTYHLMPSDDIYRHLFGGKGFHPYFRTGQKRETYGNRNH